MKATHFGEKYACPLCDVTYVEVSRIKTHIKKVHKLDICQPCGHFEKPEEEHKCVQGGLAKARQSGRSKRQTGVLYSCKACKLTFLTPKELDAHDVSQTHLSNSTQKKESKIETEAKKIIRKNVLKTPKSQEKIVTPSFEKFNQFDEDLIFNSAKLFDDDCISTASENEMLNDQFTKERNLYFPEEEPVLEAEEKDDKDCQSICSQDTHIPSSNSLLTKRMPQKEFDWLESSLMEICPPADFNPFYQGLGTSSTNDFISDDFWNLERGLSYGQFELLDTPLLPRVDSDFVNCDLSAPGRCYIRM